MQWVFAINIGTLPDARWHPIKRRHCDQAIRATPGFMEYFEVPDHGTMVVFGTRPHAEKAIAYMKASRNPVEDIVFLCQADFEKREIRVRGPVDEVCMDG